MLLENSTLEKRLVYLSATISVGDVTYGPYTIARTAPADQSVTNVMPVRLPPTAPAGPMTISVTANDDIGMAVDTATLSICESSAHPSGSQELAARFRSAFESFMRQQAPSQVSQDRHVRHVHHRSHRHHHRVHYTRTASAE